MTNGERVLPHNLEAEKCVLGAILIDNRQFLAAADFVDSRDFFRDAHRRIWNAMAVLSERGDEIDLVTLKDELARGSELDEVGGPAYIAGLTDGVPRASNVDHYSKIVKEKAALRTLIHTATQVLDQAYDAEDAPTQIINGAIHHLVTLDGAIVQRQVPSHLAHIAEVMTEIREGWDAGPPAFIKSPWFELDDMLEGGVLAGEMVIMGAGPGMGKTAAAAQLARKVARDGRNVIVVSREMKRTMIGARLIAQEGKVPAGALRRQRFSPDQRDAADSAMQRLSGLPVWITHAPMTIRALREMTLAFKQQLNGLGLLIVDYLQLIGVDASIKDRRQQVEAVSAGLKSLTLEVDIAVLALSSLSRPENTKGTSAEPGLRSFRESGNIEHDADTAIILNRRNMDDELTDLIVAKSRSGRTGRLQLLFRKEFQQFDQVSNRTDYGA